MQHDNPDAGRLGRALESCSKLLRNVPLLRTLIRNERFEAASRRTPLAIPDNRKCRNGGAGFEYSGRFRVKTFETDGPMHVQSMHGHNRYIIGT